MLGDGDRRYGDGKKIWSWRQFEKKEVQYLRHYVYMCQFSKMNIIMYGKYIQTLKSRNNVASISLYTLDILKIENLVWDMFSTDFGLFLF